MLLHSTEPSVASLRPLANTKVLDIDTSFMRLAVRSRSLYVSRVRAFVLVENFGLSLQEAAERLAMSAQEANRRRRAYKVLEQMQKDESFQQLADPELYYKFHEAVGIPEVRKWLGWTESDLMFTNEETKTQFYELITPRYDEDSGRSITAKLQTREDVRNLRRILRDENAKAALLDPSRTFNEALALAIATETGEWVSQVRNAINAVDTHGQARGTSKQFKLRLT